MRSATLLGLMFLTLGAVSATPSSSDASISTHSSGAENSAEKYWRDGRWDGGGCHGGWHGGWHGGCHGGWKRDIVASDLNGYEEDEDHALYRPHHHHHHDHHRPPHGHQKRDDLNPKLETRDENKYEVKVKPEIEVETDYEGNLAPWDTNVVVNDELDEGEQSLYWGFPPYRYPPRWGWGGRPWRWWDWKYNRM
ncbi:hypothetical protein BGZ65_012114 [Modicella reniformis]|uniref:Uncharacterized protein n=1 Tax=Modicella reniformis TaxID=1440133 RepID=A0A9P6SNJ5_9FUNG|nr:hypothetical protein BGZ65_012114 [Modicella reniformis]